MTRMKLVEWVSSVTATLYMLDVTYDGRLKEPSGREGIFRIKETRELHRHTRDWEQRMDDTKEWTW